MLKKFKSFIQDKIQLQKVIAIDINILSDGKLDVQKLLVSQENGQIVYDQCETIDDKLPLVLNIRGKGVLTKQKQGKAEIGQIFSNVELDAFITDYYSSDEWSIASIFRKDGFEHIITELGLLEDKIIRVHLGYIFAPVLLEFTEQKIEQVGNLKISWNEKSIDSVEESDRLTSSIIGASVQSKFQISFVIGTLFLISNIPTEQFFKNFESLQYAKKIKFFGGVYLAALLVILLGNFLILNNLKKENKAIVIEKSQYENIYQQVEQKKSEVETKREFIAALNLQNQLSKSYISDQIAQTIPSYIQLTQLNIDPAYEKQGEYGIMYYKGGEIIIQGICANTSQCNNWKNKLENIEWIKKVELIDFGLNSDDNGEFKIRIDY